MARATVVADRLLANPVIEESAVDRACRHERRRALMAADGSGSSSSRGPTASTTWSAPSSGLGATAELVWHGTPVAGYDALVLPGGFAHGDYLRPGAIARFSPVMEAVADVRRRRAARWSASATASRC